MLAYVLITAQGGKSKLVAQRVARVVGVKSACAVTGLYDVIAQVEGESVNEIGGMVLSKVQAVQGVVRTMTCFVVE